MSRYNKIYISEWELEVLNKYALGSGRTQEWFDKWVEDCVIVVLPLLTVEEEYGVLRKAGNLLAKPYWLVYEASARRRDRAPSRSRHRRHR